MKKIIIFTLACFISATVFCQATISIDSVSAHIGDSVNVCSKVYGVKSLENISFINLGAAYPNSLLTVVIHADDRGNFPQPVETMYDNKNVCVTGTITEYKGRPQITISNPKEIAIQP